MLLKEQQDLFEVEYAVQMKCDSCRENITAELRPLAGVEIVSIGVEEQRLVVRLDQNAPSAFEIQELIERKLGLNTIIRGTGDFVSAVSEIHGSTAYPGVRGVARFTQNESKQCLLDAVIDGLDDSRPYTIGVHEYGDLTHPQFHSIGERIFTMGDSVFHSKSSRLTAKARADNCDLGSFIGRAFAISTCGSTISTPEHIAAGIMARSSRILDNSKKICDCTGKTLWQERTEKQKQ